MSQNDVNKESIALLEYMVHHNEHHAEELAELASKLEGKSKEIVDSALVDLGQSNQKLAEALKLLKEG